MRVYELARELSVESSDILAKCKTLGLKQKNRLGGVSEEEAVALRKALADKAPSAKAPAPQKPLAAKQRAPAARGRAPAKQAIGPKKAPPAGAAPKREAAVPTPERAAPPGDEHPKGRKQRPTRLADDDPTLAVRARPLPGRYTPPSAIPRYPRRPPRRGRGKRVKRPLATAPKAMPSALQAPMSVKDLSASTGIKANMIIAKLMQEGTMVTINAVLDEEQIGCVAKALGLDVTVREAVTAETAVAALEKPEDTLEDLKPRAPVVTFLGHVDHGKTSLLDCIRKSHVVDQEHGGITQHTAAYRVTVGEHTVVFLDTPGHEAFTAMRARGANVTDIVALVVAADDGVMPQTEEAIDHARAAGVPIVVAINKCDKGEANPTRVKQQLSALDLQPEEWGGQTVCVEVSALTGNRVDELVEMLALVAELAELKANPDRPARGTVLEANVSGSRGPIATVLVREGTLRIGQVILCGATYGRVKALFDDRNRPIHEAGPSWPVVVVGLGQLPEAGDPLIVLDDLHQARAVAEERQHEAREASMSRRAHVSLENLFSSIEAGEVRELRLILKGDVSGTLEAVCQMVEGISSPEVKTHVLRASVGGISVSDVLLADASDAIIVGLNITPDTTARMLAEEKGVAVRVYNVIYRVKEDIEQALSGMLEPEERETVAGHAEVRRIFRISRVGSIAGCHVTDGAISRSNRVRLVREGVVIHTGRLGSLRREKDDVREVREGFECGMHIESYDDVKVGDVIEFFQIEKIARTLDTAGSDSQKAAP